MAELITTRQVTLHGAVQVEGETIVSLSANISSDPKRSSSYSEAITNSIAYYENRESARDQIEAFRDKMHEVEDQLIQGEQVENEPVVEPKPDEEPTEGE